MLRRCRRQYGRRDRAFAEIGLHVYAIAHGVTVLSFQEARASEFYEGGDGGAKRERARAGGAPAMRYAPARILYIETRHFVALSSQLRAERRMPRDIFTLRALRALILPLIYSV